VTGGGERVVRWRMNRRCTGPSRAGHRDHLRFRESWRLSFYHRSRRVNEAVTIDNEPLYVSHSFTESGRVVAPLRDVVAGSRRSWTTTPPLAAALKPAALQLGFVDEKTFDRSVDSAKMARSYVAAPV
jgi:hypothetical protein